MSTQHAGIKRTAEAEASPQQVATPAASSSGYKPRKRVKSDRPRPAPAAVVVEEKKQVEEQPVDAEAEAASEVRTRRGVPLPEVGAYDPNTSDGVKHVLALLMNMKNADLAALLPKLYVLTHNHAGEFSYHHNMLEAAREEQFAADEKMREQFGFGQNIPEDYIAKNVAPLIEKVQDLARPAQQAEANLMIDLWAAYDGV